MDSDSEMESKLITLITQLASADRSLEDWASNYTSAIIQIVTLVRSIQFDSQPKPETELMSLITQAISVFKSMDLDSQPKPLSKPISLITQLLNSTDSDLHLDPSWDFIPFIFPALSLEQEPELISLIYQICSRVVSLNPKWNKLISLRPQVEVTFRNGKFYEEASEKSLHIIKWDCLPLNWKIFCLEGEDATHFCCISCNGKNHDEYRQAPVEIKHPLHPKHPLRLVMCDQVRSRECYCCEKDLIETFYFCLACDFALNIVRVEKPPILTIDHPKRHEHTLVLFPRLVSLTCNLCALDDTSSAIYMCPPCDFFVHRRCINLPRVIKISRHPHRLSFTHSFHQRDLPCGVCRTKIDNDYGGYSCIKDSCSYAVHSRCATQDNVWDGKELEGESEEIEEEKLEPFVSISDGVIRHFLHQQHHLILDENTNRDYDDESKQCQACITPIYFGNFYTCMECDFLLHQVCANLSRKIYHPIHPHMLTLMGGHDGVINFSESFCSACRLVCAGGFFYDCKECRQFKVHVQCATVSEPLVHGSHMHHLFLTSKPQETRICSVCTQVFMETFNCIECDFALCFLCATIPEKVRYKHDKHILTLSYGKETSNTLISWCEVCEGKIDLNKRFYTCDEYCCVTLHMQCLLGEDLYMKPNSSWYFDNGYIIVLPNNHRASRPICSNCPKRCPYKIVLQYSGLILCSLSCIWDIKYKKMRDVMASRSLL